MNWSSTDNIILWVGHFLIGFIYYLRFYLLVTKEEFDEGVKRAIEEKPEVEQMIPLLKRKGLVLMIFLIIGYCNLLITLKKIISKMMKK